MEHWRTTMFNGTGRLKPRHLLIFVTPSIVTIVVVALWALLRSKGFFVPASDAEISTNAYLPIQGAMYALGAAIVLNRVIEEDVRVHELVDARDIKGLQKELRKRIHPLVHLLMLLLSGILTLGVITLPYESFWSGLKDVGGLVFSLALYWRVATVLDNHLRAPWIRDVIPQKYKKRSMLSTSVRTETKLFARPGSHNWEHGRIVFCLIRI